MRSASPPTVSYDVEVGEEMSLPSDEETNGELKEPLESNLNLETHSANSMEHIIRNPAIKTGAHRENSNNNKQGRNCYT